MSALKFNPKPTPLGSVLPLKATEVGLQAHLLMSWKEIAAYLGRGVRTVQRWEKEFGLPVRRSALHSRVPVSADPRDIDRWIESVHRHGISHSESARPLPSPLWESVQTFRLLRSQNAMLRESRKSEIAKFRANIAKLRKTCT
jgi:hypothetical protein